MDPNSPAESPSPPPPPSYIVAETVKPTPPPRNRIGLFGCLLSGFLLLVLGGSLLLNLYLASFSFSFDSDRRVREKFFSHERLGRDKVAILSIKGVIIGSDDSFVKRQIDQATKDKTVKAVVLRVDSPGGTVSGSDYYYHHLRKLADERGIPLVVSMGSVAASGGYYVAMAAGSNPDTIFAEPTTWTGSIGVIIPHYNAGDLMEKLGIQEDAVASGPLKNMGTFSRPMNDTEREIFRALVANGFTRFKDVIKQGRPKFRDNPQTLDKLATGQIFSADQAKQSGLVDRIGYIEEAVDRAIELAGLNRDDVRVVKYEPELGLLDSLFGMEARRPALDLTAFLDLTSPRAYYLATRLPILMSSEP